MPWTISDRLEPVYYDDPRTTMEDAEWGVWKMCGDFGVDFATISDTGTVDNLLDVGYTLDEIADRDVSEEDFLDNVYPIDGDEL